MGSPHDTVNWIPTAVTITLIANNTMKVYTTVSLTALPTPAGPPPTEMPLYQAIIPAAYPNSVALTIETMTSARPVSVVSPVTNAPAETCWTYTVKKNAPTRPTTVTADSSAKATVVAASTRGTTKR